MYSAALPYPYEHRDVVKGANQCNMLFQQFARVMRTWKSLWKKKPQQRVRIGCWLLTHWISYRRRSWKALAIEV